MLLDSEYTIVPVLKFSLTYSDGVRKLITVRRDDVISCEYKKNGERISITGKVAKICCNFNSSLGAVGTTAFMEIDGSAEYAGEVVCVKPSEVLDLTVISSSGRIENIVCSVDNEDQRISLIRQNEVGVFQYSLDGVTWKAATGAQGMSAYECAVKLGFEGTEEEWLASLKGQKGDDGDPGALEVYKVFRSIEEAEHNRDLIPKGKLVVVALPDQSLLLVRNGSKCKCNCGIESDGEIFDVEMSVMSDIRVKGYDFVGYLNQGPAGPAGRPGEDGEDGKSAYQYAVEGGFPGTEAEFTRVLGRSAVAVTNYYMGPHPTFDNTVIGPIDLRIFGYTEIATFISKCVTRIDITCTTEQEDQTLIFPEPIILRAVPTDNEAAKPNVIIRGQKYVADCIMQKDGQVGVFRRIRYIESYNGETILGDWISSTGELDLGAKVQFVSYGRFEPFSEEVQAQYKKLHAYDNNTTIKITEACYVSVVYPMDIKKFMESYVSEYVHEYLDEHAEEVITPIVRREIGDKLDAKQDKLTAGEHIQINHTTNVISVTGIGDLGESATVVDYVNDKIAPVADEVSSLGEEVTSLGSRVNEVETKEAADVEELNGKIEDKQNQLTAGENITIEDDVISCNVDATMGETFVTTKTVGGIEAGTTISGDMRIVALLKQILCPELPPVQECVYVGSSVDIPTSLTGLTQKPIAFSELLAKGFSNRYTADNAHLVYAYDASLGELISIKDGSGFEQLGGWHMTTISENGSTYNVYYSDEQVTISNFKLTFIYTE